MSDRAKNKIIIVTGAASKPGIGYTTSVSLAREGASVVVTDVDRDGAERCAEQIRAEGGDSLALSHDVADETSWNSVIAATLQHYGRLDGLVNNAGIAVLKPIAELSLHDWNRQIAVNLTGTFLGCRAAAAEMKKTGGGSIINLSSVAGLIGIPTCAAYAASKGGVRLMTKALAAELGEFGVRFNSVHPGVIWTSMQAQAGGGAREPAEQMASTLPLRRVGEPQDIANIIVYLASDESSYVTGAEFTIDAGMTAV